MSPAACNSAFSQSEKYPEALQELDQAIQIDPNVAHTYNARGYVYLRQHDYPHALADFNDAIRLQPNYPNAYMNRSVARKALGDGRACSYPAVAAHSDVVAAIRTSHKERHVVAHQVSAVDVPFRRAVRLF